MNIRHILAPTDFSACAYAALEHAVRLADRFEATLHLVHVINELDADAYGLVETERGVGRLGERIESEAHHRLRKMASDAAGFEIETAVLQRLNLDIDAALDEYVREHAIDLIAMGTHGRTRIGRLMLGSVANRVIRRTACPVMTIREVPERDEPSHSVDYEDILAPIDFSEHSRVALGLAKDVAARYDARLHLLFVAERRVVPTFSDTGLPGVNVLEMDPDIVANAQAALESLNENVGGPDVKMSYHVKKGEVAKDIIDFAETQDVDLIAIATRGLTGFNRFLLGSNTERVVRVAPCPVLTVPARETESEN